jgi:uncharacterized protein
MRTAISSELVFAAEIKRVLIAGGSGFIGSVLTRALLAQNIEVTVISRNPRRTQTQFAQKVRVVASADALDANAQFDAIVHLAGANVFALPWFAARKRTLQRSRLGIADALLEFVRRAQQPPKIWLQASAVGIYPTLSRAALDEQSPPGVGFAAALCQEIEARVASAQALGLRGVALRFGLVLGRSGGVFPAMRLGTQLGGGAVMGSGEQFVAWVHVTDAVHVIASALSDARYSGPINVVAPDAPRYREFATALAQASRRPMLWRVPSLLMKIALGERAPLLLEGAEILPKQLAAMGFDFRFPTLQEAFADLCAADKPV